MTASKLVQGVRTAFVALAALVMVGSSAQAQTLQGDCNANSQITIGELVRCANIFNMPSRLPECPACDQNGDGSVSIGEVQGAANCFLNPTIDEGCRPITPPITPDATLTPTSTSGPASPTNTEVPPATNTPIPTNTAAPASPTNTSAPASPTNTQVIPPTITATPITPATNTATVVPSATNTLVPTVAQPTATATAGAALDFDVILQAGGGTSTNCRGVCNGGTDNGKTCRFPLSTATCRRYCVGGTSAPNSVGCVANNNCPGGGTCPTGNVCGAASWKAGQTCTADTQCPRDCPNSTGDFCVGPGKCVGGALDGMACTSGSTCAGCNSSPSKGSCARIQPKTTALPVLALNGICFPRQTPDLSCASDDECAGIVGGPGTCRFASMKVSIGAPNPDGTRPVFIDQDSLFLPPVIVPGLGTNCIQAGGDGNGVLDCVGGRAGVNFTLSQDHNTSPQNACSGGPNAGTACTCPTAGVGCYPDTCPDFPANFHTCAANGTCTGGRRASQSCTSSANCPGANYYCNRENSGVGTSTFPDDVMCTNTITQPTGVVSNACLEGTGTCVGGSRDGMFCRLNGVVGEQCPGGECDLCNAGSNHAAVCNSATKVEVAGTFAAGDMVVVMPLAIVRNPGNGPDNLPCTADDVLSSPPATVPVILSTGTNAIKIYDANNTLGATLGPGEPCALGQPCVTSTTGQKLNCSNLTAGDLTGALNGLTLGGGFPALDVAGDIAVTFRFVVDESEVTP